VQLHVVVRVVIEIRRLADQHRAQLVCHEGLPAIEECEERILCEALPANKFDQIELFYNGNLRLAHLALVERPAATEDAEQVRPEAGLRGDSLEHVEVPAKVLQQAILFLHPLHVRLVAVQACHVTENFVKHHRPHGESHNWACDSTANDRETVKETTDVSEPLQHTVSGALHHLRVGLEHEGDRGELVAAIRVCLSVRVTRPSAGSGRVKLKTVKFKFFVLSVLDHRDFIL